MQPVQQPVNPLQPPPQIQQQQAGPSQRVNIKQPEVTYDNGSIVITQKFDVFDAQGRPIPQNPLVKKFYISRGALSVKNTATAKAVAEVFKDVIAALEKEMKTLIEDAYSHGHTITSPPLDQLKVIIDAKTGEAKITRIAPGREGPLRAIAAMNAQDPAARMALIESMNKYFNCQGQFTSLSPNVKYEVVKKLYEDATLNDKRFQLPQNEPFVRALRDEYEEAEKVVKKMPPQASPLSDRLVNPRVTTIKEYLQKNLAPVTAVPAKQPAPALALVEVGQLSPQQKEDLVQWVKTGSAAQRPPRLLGVDNALLSAELNKINKDYTSLSPSWAGTTETDRGTFAKNAELLSKEAQRLSEIQRKASQPPPVVPQGVLPLVQSGVGQPAAVQSQQQPVPFVQQQQPVQSLQASTTP